MSSTTRGLLTAIQNESERSKAVQDVFVMVQCLFETHFQHRPSSLLGIYPDLNDVVISQGEAEEFKQALVQFVEECSSHDCVPSAVNSLALTGDIKLLGFFVTQLRKHLAWKNPAVTFQLLSAIEQLGQKVFYDADGRFIGSPSSCESELNFGVANRYLAKLDESS